MAADDAAARADVVREHVYGVDADPLAIHELHRKVARWIGGESARPDDYEDLLAAQFPCGDALVGTDWRPESLFRTDAPSSPVETAIDWGDTFPAVAAEGGFNLVIGNPPYRREKSARHDFDRIASSQLGQRWRSARMDLWHYFFHRGLDLLKLGGRLTFIVNSYWIGSTAAAPLRQRMVDETSMEELVLLGSARVFPDVSGRHMIFRVRATDDRSKPCRVLDLSHQCHSQIQSRFSQDSPGAEDSFSEAQAVRQDELWSGNRLLVHAQATIHAGTKSASGLKPPMLPTRELTTAFDVRQGIAENPPFVTKSAALELGQPELAGTGVFVLTRDEVTALNLTEQDQLRLRPYYSLASLGRFHVAAEPSHQILYLTRITTPELDTIPRLAAHLEKFRPILQRRREAMSGRIAWWHLHWPREERLFRSPRILCLQMGHEPRFAYAEKPTYVGFSVNVITEHANSRTQAVSLPALTAMLNSAFARHWFETHAKRRGVHLDISGAVLKQFPVPTNPSAKIVADLDQLTRTWRPDLDAEARLNELVEALYLESPIGKV